MKFEYSIGVDIGGTFTDLVIAAAPSGETRSIKTLTTPSDPVQGVLKAVKEALEITGCAPEDVKRFVHATTLPTNLVLERRGAKVAFVATKGFGDMFAISKQYPTGPQQFEVNYQREKPFVAQDMVFEIDERITAKGAVHRPLDVRVASVVVEQIAAAEPEAVAICLMHAYANPEHERQLELLVRERLPGLYVSVSSQIWPEYGEYERAAATLIAAYVGATLSAYVGRLSDMLAEIGIPCPLQIMQSNGGVMAAGDSARRAVYSIESGPAAGVMAAAHVGHMRGLPDLIAFDMGGTTAKLGLVQHGRPRITQKFRVGGKASYGGSGEGEPIRIPVVDLAEVGAGGGSIAWIDEGGFLQVGPRSASAFPGPACYKLGGTEATVTDANVALGYLSPTYFLGGRMEIDAELSKAAITRLADRLGMESTAVAKGIYDLAIVRMGSAVRIVTLQRGIDPREYAIVASGGAAPLHVVQLAEQFGIPTAIVPPSPGVLSAMGLLVSDLLYDYVLTTIMPASHADLPRLQSAFDEMERQARSDLAGESKLTLLRQLEMRFTNQVLNMPITIPDGPITEASIEAAEAAFREAYFAVSGLRSVDTCQVVNCRMQARAAADKPLARIGQRGDGDPARAVKNTRPAYFTSAEGFVESTVYDRARLAPGDIILGPAIVEEPDSTTICPPDYRIEVDLHYNLVIGPSAGQ